MDPVSHRHLDLFATGAPDPQCPVCLGVAALRDHGPAVLDRVAGLSAGLARALREAVPEPEVPAYDQGAGDDRPPPPTTVRIDVSE